jgi:hypothetical protein
MSTFPQAGLDRLAERIAAGEAVFFIGSGFSVDSEGNDSYRLIGRLLARFDALTRLLQNDPSKSCKALELRKGMCDTFPISESPEGFLTTPDQVKKLAREYYTFNDWITSAFGLLLGELENVAKASDPKSFLDRLRQEEEALLAKLKGTKEARIPLSALSPEDLNDLLKLLPADRGKALFLETMGFADQEVMAGCPHDSDSLKAQESYGERLRPRHRVLAWLAREGIAPTLLTTNFDLLLEGAYRMAGLIPRFPLGFTPLPGEPLKPMPGTPPATFDAFCRIASATQFFGGGDDRRSAHLLKIHGCAESYRWARRDGKEALRNYLPALVFTFREIQNWREDSWSRDLVSTLLRTRTIVFCGYSTADPVLHDTIRTVYEEMARRRGPRDQAKTSTGEEAPAFFFGGADKTEFYGMEILRAASRAAGCDPDLIGHPNYLRFHFLEGQQARFPNLDEMMRWLFHLTFRRRQARALQGDLGRIATLLLGHPCPEAELKVVMEEYEKLIQAEKKMAESWTDQPGDRLVFERIVGWTERFHRGLLRELALADAALSSPSPGLEMERLRRSPWYYPALDHTDWAAWGAVVELALRRRISAWQDPAQPWERDQPWLSTAPGIHPSVLYAKDDSQPTPCCLTLRLRPPGGRGQGPTVRGAYRRHPIWELDYGEIPWRPMNREAKVGNAPDAATIWSWAHKPLSVLAGESDATLF